MTYFPKTQIELADGHSVDAFGRLRTGIPVTLFDDKQVTSIRDLLWTYRFISNATASFDRFRASSVLTASSTIGSRVVKQTKNAFNYQPGKSLTVDMSFVFGPPSVGHRKRIGYFNDLNGIYVEDNSGNKNICIRSSVTGVPVNQVITQSNWNLDKLDGTGPSGVTLDFSKGQIFHIDMQWLGTGRVRTGFEINGVNIFAHQFLHSNVSSSVYMSNPNLHIRAEIENLSSVTTGTLEQICCTVISEGGYNAEGVQRSANRNVTTQTGVTNAYFSPIISIRIGTNFTGSTIRPAAAQVLCTTTANYLWAVFYNPSFGADAASWVVVPSSSVEYDVSRAGTNALTGGLMIASGYGTNTIDVAEASFLSALSLGSSIDGVSDQFVLAAKVVGGTTEQFLGAVSWKEYF